MTYIGQSINPSPPSKHYKEEVNLFILIAKYPEEVLHRVQQQNEVVEVWSFF